MRLEGTRMKDIVSIIVPVYKQNYLDRCISSLTKQTYNKLQIILVNDGSKDGSLDICKKWKSKDSRIVLIEKENGGVASARNTGIEYAIDHNPEGYLTFIDDDDFMAVDGIESLVELVNKENTEIAWADFYVMYAETGEIENPQDERGIEILSAHEILMKEDWRTSYSLVWGKLFKVSLWKDIRLPSWCRAYDDGATTFKIIYNAGRVAVTKKKVLYYFLSKEGITRNKMTESRCREALFTQTEKISFYEEKNEKDLLKMAYVAYINDILNNMVHSVVFDKDKSFLKEMKKLYRKNAPKAILSKILMKDRAKYILYYIYPELVAKRNGEQKKDVKR